MIYSRKCTFESRFAFNLVLAKGLCSSVQKDSVNLALRKNNAIVSTDINQSSTPQVGLRQGSTDSNKKII